MIVTLDTLPVLTAWAFAEHSMASRQPLPTPPAFEKPTVYFAPAAPAEGAAVAAEPLHAVATTAIAASAANPRAIPSFFMYEPLLHSPTAIPGGLSAGPSSLEPSRKSRLSASSSLVDRTGEPPRMLSIGSVEHRPGPLGAHCARARDHRGPRPTLHQELGGPDLDGVDDGDRPDGRTGSHRALQPVDRHEGVRVRGAHVEHEVGDVHEPDACRGVRLPGQRLGDRRDGDHAHAPGLRALGHLHGDRRMATRGEHHHDVMRPEGEVPEDDLGKARRPLDEHRLALAIGADDLRVERHRQLDDRVEARVRAVAREHLLDRDARVPGAEEVDEPVVGDGIGSPLACRLDRVSLRGADAIEHRGGLAQPVCRLANGNHHAVGSGRAVPAAFARARSASSVRTGSQWPLRIARYAASRIALTMYPSANVSCGARPSRNAFTVSAIMRSWPWTLTSSGTG